MTSKRKHLLNPLAPRVLMESRFYYWQWKRHSFSSRFRGFCHYYQLTCGTLNARGVHVKTSQLGSRDQLAMVKIFKTVSALKQKQAEKMQCQLTGRSQKQVPVNDLILIFFLGMNLLSVMLHLSPPDVLQHCTALISVLICFSINPVIYESPGPSSTPIWK